MSNVIDLNAVRIEDRELAIAKMWDAFADAAQTAFEWRDFESLAEVVVLVEALKETIEVPPEP